MYDILFLCLCVCVMYIKLRSKVFDVTPKYYFHFELNAALCLAFNLFLDRLWLKLKRKSFKTWKFGLIKAISCDTLVQRLNSIHRNYIILRARLIQRYFCLCRLLLVEMNNELALFHLISRRWSFNRNRYWNIYFWFCVFKCYCTFQRHL